MKVSELFEASIGYNAEKKSPTGSTKDWLKAMGATQEHIDEAMKKIRQAPAYKEMLKVGQMKDNSSERDTKNGTISFEGEIVEIDMAAVRYERKPRQRRIKYKVLANGKIDVVQQNDYHRYAGRSGKPALVLGDPVSSIVKSMSQAMESLKDTIAKRYKKAEIYAEKHAKALAKSRT